MLFIKETFIINDILLVLAKDMKLGTQVKYYNQCQNRIITLSPSHKSIVLGGEDWERGKNLKKN